MQIEIEKNVPMPLSRVSLYPFAQMNVGDSFAIPLTGRLMPNGRDRVVNTLAASAVRYAKKATGKKFTIRTIKDEGVARCWRVA